MIDLQRYRGTSEEKKLYITNQGSSFLQGNFSKVPIFLEKVSSNKASFFYIYLQEVFFFFNFVVVLIVVKSGIADFKSQF